MSWDPAQYAQFRDERSRAFFELLARVRGTPNWIADLGCGTGELTAVLADRWPTSRVIGIDSSKEMLAKVPRGRIEFVNADLAEWRPLEPLDLIFSNAALQWVPEHERVMSHLLSMLGADGAMAVQMPFNYDEPSHVILSEVVREGPWAETLRQHWRSNALNVQPLSWYVDTVWKAGFEVDAWETVYTHILRGMDPVLEWLKGTALRPVLSVLDVEDQRVFLERLRRRLREAYPVRDGATLFPFRRIFFVATTTSRQPSPT